MALADTPNPAAHKTRGPFGGMIDLQPGAINGQVDLQPGSISIQGRLADPGVDGQLQVSIPGQFVGTAPPATARLSYDLALCGPGVSPRAEWHPRHERPLRVPGHRVQSWRLLGRARPRRAVFMSPLLARSQPTTSDTDVQSVVAQLAATAGRLLAAGAPAGAAHSGHAPRARGRHRDAPVGPHRAGMAVALIMPLLGILLFVMGLPVGLWWLGAILLALYPVLLMLSMSVSGLAFGSWLSRRVSRPGCRSWPRSWWR